MSTNTKLAEALRDIAKYTSDSRARYLAEREAFDRWFQDFRHGWKSEKDVAFDAWQAREQHFAQRQPLTEWQPIETAPKDGTRLILSDGKFVGAGVWVGRYFAWGVSPEPTHWMPLPAAPGTTTGEQR